MTDSGDNIHVLYVDGDAGDGADALEGADGRLRVTTATTGSEGLSLLGERQFDCAVVEYDLPDRSGVDLVASIRAERSPIPVVMFTGVGSETVASEALGAGAADYLPKDGDGDRYAELAGRLRRAVTANRVATTAADRRRELAEKTARVEVLFERSPDMINVHDADGNIIDPNARLCEETGYDREELEGMKVWEIDEAVDPSAVQEVWDDMDVGDSERFQGRYQRRDGSTFPVEVHVRRLDLEGRERFVAISRDVTDQRERERKLRRESDRFRAVFEKAFDAMVIADDDGRYVDANASATELFSLPKAELLGQSIRDFAPEEFDFESAWHEFRTTDEERGTFPLVRPDGTERIVEYAATRDIVPGQHLSVLRDVTERQERDERLRQQNERLEEFAGVVSHDLRNPLNVAAGRLELARRECDSEHLDAVDRAHDRMGELIGDLLTLARKGDPETDGEAVALDDLVKDCWGSVATADATFAADFERAVLADPGRLRRLFENLLRNAVEHGGDDVHVEAGELEDGFYVADDGPGIPAEDRDAVFDVGYSTTPDGTGFGLSIVARIAAEHGWSVSVGDGPDGGARFEISGVEFVPIDDDRR